MDERLFNDISRLFGEQSPDLVRNLSVTPIEDWWTIMSESIYSAELFWSLLGNEKTRLILQTPHSAKQEHFTLTLKVKEDWKTSCSTFRRFCPTNTFKIRQYVIRSRNYPNQKSGAGGEAKFRPSSVKNEKPMMHHTTRSSTCVKWEKEIPPTQNITKTQRECHSHAPNTNTKKTATPKSTHHQEKYNNQTQHHFQLFPSQTQSKMNRKTMWLWRWFFPKKRRQVKIFFCCFWLILLEKLGFLVILVVDWLGIWFWIEGVCVFSSFWVLWHLYSGILWWDILSAFFAFWYDLWSFLSYPGKIF